MSASTIGYYMYASKQVIIFLGTPIFIAGIIGAILNTIVFLSLQTFRQSSSAFYLTIMSIVNTVYLFVGVFPRIVTSIYNTDGTETSLFYCKFRNYCTTICTTISMTCFCLATIDQCCATCSRPRFQQCIALMLLLLLLYGCLPVFVSMLFGTMAFVNVQQLARYTVLVVRRDLDKQLTIMVLTQVVVDVIAIIPYIIIYAIQSNTILDRNSITMAQIQFAYNTLFTVYYLYFASPFYIYICASERFRRQLIYVLFKIHLNRCKQKPRIANNQIQHQS